jgi:hypothetical protein
MRPISIRTTTIIRRAHEADAALSVTVAVTAEASAEAANRKDKKGKKVKEGKKGKKVKAKRHD